MADGGLADQNRWHSGRLRRGESGMVDREGQEELVGVLTDVEGGHDQPEFGLWRATTAVWIRFDMAEHLR